MSDQFSGKAEEDGPHTVHVKTRETVWDNAAMEIVSSAISRTIVILRDVLRFQEVKKMIDDYIEYYNNERPQMDKDEDDACRICQDI